MRVLGIETSCDETSASVVEDGRVVLSNEIYSQIKIHRKTQGIVPEVAAREHVLKIIPIIDMALKSARISLSDIDCISVANGPGLQSSLIIGTVTASTFSLVLNKPIIPVNHIHGHLYSTWLCEKSRDIKEFSFPIVTLSVSGGHNELILIKEYEHFAVLGETRDDSAGEAFDKTARILGLPYPGGPSIEKAAKKGNPALYNFPRSMLEKNSFDFSFSGLKTAVLYHVQKSSVRNKQFIADTAASFQAAITDVLALKLVSAGKKYHAREIHLVGGVSANSALRERILQEIELTWLKKVDRPTFRFSRKLSYCTDNAGMIAVAGYFKYINNKKAYSRWKPVIVNPS